MAGVSCAIPTSGRRRRFACATSATTDRTKGAAFSAGVRAFRTRTTAQNARRRRRMYVVVNAPALFVARHSSPETTLSHPPPFAPTPLPTGRTRTHASTRAHTSTHARRHALFALRKLMELVQLQLPKIQGGAPPPHSVAAVQCAAHPRRIVSKRSTPCLLRMCGTGGADPLLSRQCAFHLRLRWGPSRRVMRFIR